MSAACLLLLQHRRQPGLFKLRSLLFNQDQAYKLRGEELLSEDYQISQLWWLPYAVSDSLLEQLAELKQQHLRAHNQFNKDQLVKSLDQLLNNLPADPTTISQTTPATDPQTAPAITANTIRETAPEKNPATPSTNTAGLANNTTTPSNNTATPPAITYANSKGNNSVNHSGDNPNPTQTSNPWAAPLENQQSLENSLTRLEQLNLQLETISLHYLPPFPGTAHHQPEADLNAHSQQVRQWFQHKEQFEQANGLRIQLLAEPSTPVADASGQSQPTTSQILFDPPSHWPAEPRSTRWSHYLANLLGVALLIALLAWGYWLTENG